MKQALNRQVCLIARPIGIPQASDFEIRATPVSDLQDGQICVRNVYLSVEPAMRGWVNSLGNYSEPVAIGSVMRSFAVGIVEASRSINFPVNSWVTGLFGWQEYAVVDADKVDRIITESDLTPSTALGVLGINGITAHYGLLKIGEPKAGETVVVSTAAGAVGSCVGQIAKLKNCRTIGITGGEKKRKLCLDHFGFDEAVDYKATDFHQKLSEACAGGVDVYFDNTSGEISDAVFSHLNIGARVIICGTASVSNWNPPPQGPRIERQLLVKRARMQGFVIFDHRDYEASARQDLAKWLRNGDIRYQEDILVGIEQAPDAIAGLYRGDNLGKRLIRVSNF